MRTPVQRRITSTTTVTLEPVDPKDGIAGPLIAINWFNTRWTWLYTLYNFLAAKPLAKIGGKVFLKAKLRHTIHGAADAGRELLLVVQYPSGDAFLGLLANRLFQAVSVLRVLAVKDFSFVFHNRQDNQAAFDIKTGRYAGDKVYAVHHFRSPDPLRKGLSKVSALAAASKISLFFASEKAAVVLIDTGRGRRQMMPFETHQLLIFEGDRHAALEDFLTAPAYREFSAHLQSSYIGVFDRIM